MNNDNHRKLVELLEDFKNAMLVTRASDNDVHVRPMRVARLTEEGELYFVTSKGSSKVNEIMHDSHVDAIFQDKSKFVVVNGNANVIEDRELIESLWSEAWKIWFPGGKNDPTICVIQLAPVQVEYWDNEGLEGLSFAFAAAKAYIKGERPKTDSDQHGKLKV
jgi:general stress protein 26